MIELLQHIEALLLESDCVIIPTFGGFVSHYAPARWMDEESIFLPPTRSIGFNPQLKMNDGLLVQSYMASYCTDFSDASKLVDKGVKELVQTLHEEGKIEIHGIGTMCLTIHDILQFQPFEDGLLTPHLYGLSSFEIDKLEYKIKAKEKATELIHSNPKVYEIRINRSFLRTSIAMAAAILIFFFMSTPIENTYVERTNYAQLIPSELFESANIKETPTSNNSGSAVLQKKQEQIKPKVVKEVMVPKKIEKKSTSTIPTATSVKNSSYYIITASVANRTDAQNVVDKLKKQGFSGASILQGDGRVRVSIMSFSNNAEANTKLSQLKKNATFKDAWLLTTK